MTSLEACPLVKVVEVVLNLNIIKSIILPFPTLEEQQKIAAILSCLDDILIAQNDKLEALEEHKRGLVQAFFPAEGKTMPKLRFLEFQDSEEWTKKTLGALTYPISQRNKQDKKLPVYSISNVGGFVPQSSQFDGVDSYQRGYDTTLYKVVDKDTFAYNPARINVGSVGYSGELSQVLISSLYVCFKTDKSLDDKFLWYFLKSNIFNKAVSDTVEGGIRSYLFYDKLAVIPITIPTLLEQKKIASCLDSLDKLITAQTQKIDALKLHKKGLMQALFPTTSVPEA